jgi:transposase InsO family protein
MHSDLKIINDTVYVSSGFLVKSGMHKRTLDNRLSAYNKSKSLYYKFFKDPISQVKWIDFSSIKITLLRQLMLPTEKDELIKYIKRKDQDKIIDNSNKIWLILNGAWTLPDMWKRYIPHYNEYFLDKEKRNLFAKTHAVFFEVIQLKIQNKYKLNEIHPIYLKLRNAVFWNDDYKYFTRKICQAQTNGIPETLVHNFKRLGRNNYKLTPLARKLITKYYSNPKKYSRHQVTEMVNFDLINRGFQEISYSTVTTFLRTPSIKNRCDILRRGKKYTDDNLLPYMSRKGPTFPHDLLQVDTTRLNFPYKDKDGKIRYIFLCVTLEVYTKRIVGHSFSESENYGMILECLKKAFINNKYIPRQIVVDNHSSFCSGEFKEFSDKLSVFGVHLRKSTPYNPKDKGQVERWFQTFSSYYLNRYVGNLGNGIRSKLEDSRASSDLEKFYRKPDNLKTEKELKILVSELIEEYNDKVDPHKNIDKNPDKKSSFKRENIAHLFFKEKLIKVRRSMIKSTFNGQLLTYTIILNKQAEALNNTYVKVRYNPDDPSQIYVFKSPNNEYLFSLRSDNPINIIPTEKEKNQIKKHNKLNEDRIRESFDKLVRDIDEGTKEINSLPIVTEIDPLEIEKRAIRNSEDNMLISEMIKRQDKRRTKRTQKSGKKEQYLSNKIYKSVGSKINLIE